MADGVYLRLERIADALEALAGVGGADTGATSDNQVSEIALLTALGAKDFATQTTLASLLARSPALGAALSAAAVPVSLATDDAQIGTKVTSIAALGTGGAGLIGWLSTISNNIATMNTVNVGGLTETAPASDTASSGLNGRLQRIAQRLTSLIALLPASLGTKTTAASLAINIASDDAQIGTKVTAVAALGAGGTGLIGWLSQIWSADQTMIAEVGSLTETAPASDTASSGLNGRLQRVAQRLTSLIALLPAAIGPTAKAGALSVTTATDDPVVTLYGALLETAPASDTASSGLNGRLQRIAQRLTSLIALLPAAIGPTAKAGALSVTTATDDPVVTLYGAVTETAPASDTASSGLNGRLQRIAQRLTSLIALIPAALGQTTMAGSLSVTVASNQSTLRTMAPASATSTRSDVAATATNSQLLAANTSRLGGAIVNDSTSILYIRLGATAATTSAYDYVLDGKTTVGGIFEIPDGWTGAIQGIWVTATGSARVHERTA